MNKVLLYLSLFILLCAPAFAGDFLVDEFLDGKGYEKPEVFTDYDFTDVDYVPIKLSICEDISTRNNDLYVGQNIYLKAISNTYYKNRLIVKRGEIVSAKIELVIDSGMNGIPYYIYLGDFAINDLPASKILGNYFKPGVNRMYWVLPLKLVLTPLPPTGSLTNFIKGGHAKITSDDIITVYYFPNWK